MSVSILQEWSRNGSLANAKLEGSKVSLDDTSLDLSEMLDISCDGKSCSYSLGSIYLQIINPNQGLLAYRNACKAQNVADPVKALDKPLVVAYFSAGEAAAAAPAAAAPVVAPPAMDKSKRREKERRKKDKKRKPQQPEAPPKKRAKKVMTHEQLLSNLNVVVDKRDDSGAANAEIHKALSAVGFEIGSDISPQVLEERKRAVDQITALEIPVGNSASILRHGKSLIKALELYNQVVDARKSSSKHSSSKRGSSHKNTSGGAPTKAYLRGKRPVIVLSKGMTSPITMLNAYEFFCNRTFVPRDVAKKTSASNNKPTSFVHTLDARNGGGSLEFELMDNPRSKLGHDPKEWERIVAVVAQGASWQFKDWPGPIYNNPVSLFQHAKGFYISMEGDKIPQELQGWKVVKGMLNRDKRGLDSVTFANFWKSLEEFMSVHKREMLPQKE